MTRTTIAALAVGGALTLAACSSHSSSPAAASGTTAAATSAVAPAATSAVTATSGATAAATASATTAAGSVAPTSPAAVVTSSVPSKVAAPSVPATVTSPGSTPVVTTKPATPTATVSAVAGAHCLNAQLGVSLKAGSPGAGQIYTTIVFTNTSTLPCTLSGHPGVSYVAGSDGHQVGTSATREAGAITTVTLAPTGTASATLHETNYQNFDQAVCKPVQTEGLRIYPPGGTRSFFVRRPGMQCSALVLPDPALSISVVKAGSAD